MCKHSVCAIYVTRDVIFNCFENLKREQKFFFYLRLRIAAYAKQTDQHRLKISFEKQCTMQIQLKFLNRINKNRFHRHATRTNYTLVFSKGLTNERSVSLVCTYVKLCSNDTRLPLLEHLFFPFEHPSIIVFYAQITKNVPQGEVQAYMYRRLGDKNNARHSLPSDKNTGKFTQSPDMSRKKIVLVFRLIFVFCCQFFFLSFVRKFLTDLNLYA